MEDPTSHVDDVFSGSRVRLEEVHRLVSDAGGVDLRPVGSEVLLSRGEDRLEVLDLRRFISFSAGFKIGGRRGKLTVTRSLGCLARMGN